MCDSCLLTTTGVSRLRGNGDHIYAANCDVPKNMFINVKNRTLDPEKDDIIQNRSELAKVDVLKSAKSR